jgi:crotonobetainyl-CoA:carnitine CoA-transferase CaiB-like acyl-CoA transferase
MILSGLRVLEFTIAWAGPLAGRFLADLGAEVVHLEHASSRGVGTTGVGGFRVSEEIGDWKWGDLPGPVFRSGIYPDADPGERPWNRQGMFNKMQRNKLSLCMDVKTPEGHEALIELIKVSDIVLDNFSPRGIRGMGLDWESLKEINPRLIRVSLSGYGHTGPDQMRVSWGPNLESHSGMAAMTGYTDSDAPMKLGPAMPDPIGGLSATVAMLAALKQRDETGEGMFIDLSQFESFGSIGGELYLSASITGTAPERHANRSPDRAPQGLYRCLGDDEWIAISVEDDAEWAALAGVLGGAVDGGDMYASLAGRIEHHDELDETITAWTSSRAKFDAMHELQAAGVRAGAVMSNKEIVEDEHLAARGFMVDIDAIDVGVRSYPGFPIHFEDPAEIPMVGSPPLGHDNAKVLSEWLGYSPERIRELEASGVLADTAA